MCKNKKLVSCGKIVLGLAAFALAFYPNYVDHKLGKEYCGLDERSGYHDYLFGHGIQWGPDEGFGVWGIREGILSKYFEHAENGWQKKNIDSNKDSGIVIVLRPRSKWGIENTFISGVYTQEEFGDDQKGGRGGVSAILYNAR